MLILAITLAIALPLALRKEKNNEYPEFRLEAWFNSNKKVLESAGYSSYVVKDATEIEHFMKGNGMGKYFQDVSALVNLGGLFTGIEFKTIESAQQFSANYKEVVKDKNLVLMSNNYGMAKLYYAKITDERVGIVASLSSGEKVLLKAKGSTIANVNVIGYRALVDIDSDNIAIDSALTRIDNQAFFSNDSIKTITFTEENNVKYIGDMAFNNCASLQSLSLKNAKELGEFAFSKCSI